MTKKTLSSLINIGVVLAEKLEQVGVETPEELISHGSENSFMRLFAADKDICVNSLLALEGAIQGIRWHNLDDSRKAELGMFYKMCKKQKV